MSLTGTTAPDFELPSTSGGTRRLSETLENGPAILVFFRGPWCSYCAEQLETYSNLSYDLWRHYDAEILPISTSLVADLVEMRDRFELQVQLLSDPDLTVCKKYLPQTESHSEFGEVPIPATFVVDELGEIRFEHVSKNPADRTHANYVRHLIRRDFSEPYENSHFE